MILDLSNVEVSRADARQGIRLPKEIDTNLAEFLGAVVGDGHLSEIPQIVGEKTVYTRRAIQISGNLKELSYMVHLQNLFRCLFHLDIKLKRDRRSNSLFLRKNSMGVVNFIHVVGGVPMNKKSETVRIPPIVHNGSKKIKSAFLRGLADTDFTVTFQKRKMGHCYPVVKASFRSKHLVQDLVILLSFLGFTCSTFFDESRKDRRYKTRTTMHNIFLYGYENFYRWTSLVGTSNEKFSRKIEKWKQEGICPPGF